MPDAASVFSTSLDVAYALLHVLILLRALVPLTRLLSILRRSLVIPVTNASVWQSAMPSQTAYAPETVTGRTTSYMALTTPFIPSAPVKCKSAYMWEERIVAYDPAYGVSVDSNLVCGPAAFTTWWMQGRLGDGDTRISIGPLTCPQDWSTVVSSIRSKSSTLQMCCPS